MKIIYYNLLVIDLLTDKRWHIQQDYRNVEDVKRDAKIFIDSGFAVSITKNCISTNRKTNVIFSTINKI